MAGKFLREAFRTANGDTIIVHSHHDLLLDRYDVFIDGYELSVDGAEVARLTAGHKLVAVASVEYPV